MITVIISSVFYYKAELVKVGELLYREGLVDARAGNLSVRLGDKVIITRTGSHLGTLSFEDFIELPLHQKHTLEERASSEWAVHREIYLQTIYRAVVHAHPLYTIFLSNYYHRIEPKDSEGKTILGAVEVIPDYPSGSTELAEAVSQRLKNSKILVVRNHGVFSAGRTLREAYSLVSVLERSCRYLCLKF
ncbi:class II aldolase/adducin family protein [Thermocrinis sp.]